MSSFVDACRREWSRLGVPVAVANEMATDLEADLAEAEADGVSPEEVLGNGYFDPESFAASWATSRGMVDAGQGAPSGSRRRRWTMVAALAASAIAFLAGLVSLVGARQGAVAVASAVFRRNHLLPGPGAILKRPFAISGPLFGPGQRIFLLHHSGSIAVVGIVLFLVGLAGLVVTFWVWKPWVVRRRRSGPEPQIDLPSFL